MPSLHRVLRGLLLTALLAGSGLLVTAPGANAAAGVSATFTPGGVLPGDHVTATGRASTRGRRPVLLQLHTSSGWATAASSRTTRRGQYAVTDSAARTGSFRVVLPRARVHHRWLRALTSATGVVGVAADLPNGRTLATGQSLTSPDGRYRLLVQPDGDLALSAVATPATVLWHTTTSGHPGARLVMQRAGNLVLVDPHGLLLWDTGTSSTGAMLSLQSDGNLVVHQGSTVLWDRVSGVHTPAPPVATTSTAAVRGNSWVVAKVPYSQKKYYSNGYGRYRTDCSGFVSMMWGLSGSYTTRSLPSISHPISKAQLQSGDILDSPNYHVVLFDSWADAAHTRYWGYEETPNPGATHRVIPYPYWSGHRTSTFVPRRRG